MESLFAKLPVFVEQSGKLQFGRVGRKSVDVYLNDFALRETPLYLADVLLQASYDNLIAMPRRYVDATAEALRIENFEQGGEAVGMAVVRRGRKKQSMLEAVGDVADGPGDLGIDCVLLSAGGAA